MGHFSVEISRRPGQFSVEINRRADDAALTADIVALATQYGRYGYRRITALLRATGWAVNVKRVERIWRQEGLKVPSKQPKKGRLTAHACGSDRSAPTTSGPTTSSRTEPTTAGSSACSTSSTSLPVSAWRSGSTGG